MEKFSTNIRSQCTIARLGLGDRGSATRLPTGNGAAAASRGTNGGATGTTPTCGVGGASTIESSIGSSIGSSSRDATSAVCSRSHRLRRYSVPLRLTMYDRGWPSSRTTIAGNHT